MNVFGKHNVYQVVDISENTEKTQKWFKLKCIDFYDVDDLGDGIVCSALHQECWIANFHYTRMAKDD